MIHFEKHTLSNGLRVLLHRDTSTPLVAVNTLYDVGARDEDPARTGFAHLFEHLMFGGSQHIPNFDKPLQRVGGSNNAFTNNDFTNYYITLPAANIETAFWLESDRMLQLAFREEGLEVQRKVVIEEFKQRYLNEPYGDVWLHLRPMAYKQHPYRWATIGQSIQHIEEASLSEVQAFFARHYHPGNAILSVAGPIDPQRCLRQIERWYGDIPGREKAPRQLPAEADGDGHEVITLEREVPQQALYMAWPMPGRSHPDYYAADLLTDLLSRGKSSRLYTSLVKGQQLCTSASSFVTGSLDPGLLLITAMVDARVNVDQAHDALLNEVDKLLADGPDEDELVRVKNTLEMEYLVSESNVLRKAMNLAYYELLGEAAQINTVMERYRAIGVAELQRTAGQIFQNRKLKELRYLPKSKAA